MYNINNTSIFDITFSYNEYCCCLIVHIIMLLYTLYIIMYVCYNKLYYYHCKWRISETITCIERDVIWRTRAARWVAADVAIRDIALRDRLFSAMKDSGQLQVSACIINDCD